MKYTYEIELYGDLDAGSMISFKSDELLKLTQDRTGLINEFGYIIFDTNGEEIIVFEYHENEQP